MDQGQTNNVQSLHIYSRPIIHPTMRPPAPRHGLARCSPWPRPQQWAFGSGTATTALITPARRQRLLSHASDRRRSWSVTPGIQPALTLAYSIRHNDGGGRAANLPPHPRPQLCCPAPPPWQPHRMVDLQVPGGTGESAPRWGQRRLQIGKTLLHIWRC